MFYINGKKVPQRRFKDGTPLLSVNCDDSFVNLTWLYDSADELMDLVCINGCLRDRRTVKEIWLEMPYIPNARQDRVQKADDVFTLRYFAQLINSLKFDRVIVFDPHSYVSEALFDRLWVFSPEGNIEMAFEDITKKEGREPFICYPDYNAAKKYTAFVPGPYAFGIKNRDWDTRAILSLSLQGQYDKIENGQPILICDDICGQGVTFDHMARAMKEQTSCGNIYLYASHCEHSMLDGPIFKNDAIKGIYTTRSLFHEKPNDMITVFDYHVNDPYPAYAGHL